MAVYPYTVAAAEIANGTVDWGTTVFYWILLKSTAVRDGTDTVVDNVIAGAAEISVAGYARTLIAGYVAPTAANPSLCDAADTVFAALTAGQTVGSWVACRRVGGAINTAVDVPYWWHDNSPTTYPTNGGTMTVTLNASGLYTVTVS